MDELLSRIAGLSPAKREILERRIRQRTAAGVPPPPITPRAHRGWAPASFAQQRLWFLQQLAPEDASYNAPRAVRLSGTLDTAALQRALCELVGRHDTFRTRFAYNDGVLQQIIGDETLALPTIDLSELPPDWRRARADELIALEAARPFDLGSGPVIRTTLLRLADREHILLLTTHHIVSDAWSAEILFRELGQLYDAFTCGKPSPLPALPIQYADFAVWQREWLRGEVLDAHLAYWRGQLGTVTSVVEVPTDYPRAAAANTGGGLATATVPKPLTEELTALSRREGVTLFMTLLAAFDVLLMRYAAQDDVVVGSTIAGRNHAETEGLIGFFINTLALRTDVSGNPSFIELTRRVKETAVAAYAQQELPFDRIVEDLHPERDPGSTPFFRIMFQFKTTTGWPLAMRDLTVEHLPVVPASSKFDLMLTAVAKGGELRLLLEYSAALFAPETIERMLGHYVALLRHAATAPHLPIGSLAMTTADERRRLDAWNETAAPFPRDRCIHELFETQVARAPDAVAVQAGTVSITATELNARANRVAHYLRARGVGPEVRVAVCLERSIDMIVALLGILKAGGAYVPLEPSYPRERARFVLQDSGARAVLTQARLVAALPEGDVPLIRLDSDWPEIARESRENPSIATSAEHLAHVIYTSGSTGRPKGVASAHRCTVNRLAWMWDAYPFGDDEVCCQKTALSFVDAIAEIFSPLLCGVPLVIVPDEVVKDPPQFVAALAAHRITRLVAVPSLLHVLLETGVTSRQLDRLRYCVCSGEALPLPLAAACREQLPATTLLNLYGSSEVAADVTHYAVRSTDAAAIPIGRPIANTEAYVLDADLRRLPVDVPGEIHIGGEALARGYINLPDMTAERFVPDPFSGRAGARLFATGDLGRYRVDGHIEYRGRRDHQVKVRGFRIELAEIEAALETHPGVRDAVVVARGEGGDKYLAAYVVGNGDPPSTAALREHLRRMLPEYMVPSAFMRLDSLPLTTSGKVNRLALPAVDFAAGSREGATAPRTSTEEILSSIWADVLKLEAVRIDDDFFELGGHSLLLAGVAARIRNAFEVQLPLRALFETPTIAALAARIDAARVAPDAALQAPLQALPRNGVLPLSFGQERLWFADQLDPGNAAYNIPRVLRLTGTLDADALRKSVSSMVARHETLRMAFRNDTGRPVLSIRSAADVAGVAFEPLDLRHLPAAERETRARSFVVEETQRPFDLACSPLLRVALVRLDEAEHILVLTMHHIVGDAWSMGIFMRELVAFYNASADGDVVSLPALPVQYADFAAWQRQWLSGDALRPQLDYWRRQLAGAPPVSGVPLDIRRPAERRARGARHQFAIPADTTRKVKALARVSSVTLYMAVLASFHVLLSCLTGEDDIVIGSPVAGRNRPETDALIGNFVNTLVLRLQLSDDPTFEETLRRTRMAALGAFANQDVPFEKLVEELRPPRTLSHHPLFQVWFVLQNATVERDDWRGLVVQPLPVDTGTTRHDLQLTLWETSDGLAGAFTYSSDIFSASRITGMAEQFNTLLSLVTERPEVRLSEIRRALQPVAAADHHDTAERLERMTLTSLRSIARKPITSVRQRTTE